MPRADQKGRRRTTKDGTLTVAEIERQHPDEWVLVEIVGENKDYRRVTGRLLAHGVDRGSLDGPYWRFRDDHPQARVLQFFTGDVVADEGISVVL